MEKHNGKYFTMWYAVYQRSTRRLAYGGAGHPPMLLRTGVDRSSAALQQLKAQNVVIGMMSDMPYDAETVELGAFAQLYLFSDGVFEIAKPDGTMWKYDEFVQFMETLPGDESALDLVLRQARSLHGQETLADDFSLVQVTFGN
jgi:phosphoserine phosphatase RsbU/P